MDSRLFVTSLVHLIFLLSRVLWSVITFYIFPHVFFHAYLNREFSQVIVSSTSLLNVRSRMDLGSSIFGSRNYFLGTNIRHSKQMTARYLPLKKYTSFPADGAIPNSPRFNFFYRFILLPHLKFDTLPYS